MEFPRKGKPEMKRLFFAMSALAALSLLAPSAGVAQDINQIGIYTTTTPVPNSAEARWDGSLPGQLTAYVVLTNPFNDVTTQSSIVQVGGYEFHVILPAGFLITESILPGSVLNFQTAPVFYCSGLVDVTSNRALLVTLTLATFTGTEGLVYLDEVPQGASIPGSIAITDGGDNFQLVEAYPASGDLALPVFGINMDVVPNEDASWSDLKALYR